MYSSLVYFRVGIKYSNVIMAIVNVTPPYMVYKYASSASFSTGTDLFDMNTE